MTWIILLIIVGIALFFIELFFVPGTTVVGVLGLVFVGIAIFWAYSQFGKTAGHLSLLISLVVIIGLIVYGSKTNVWGKLSHKHSLTGKANIIEENKIKQGDKGVAVSDIKPIGKAMINNELYEVRSTGEFIVHGNEIEVIQFSGNKIVVRLVATQTETES